MLSSKTAHSFYCILYSLCLSDKEACEALKKKLLTSHEKFCTLAVNPCPGMYEPHCHSSTLLSFAVMIMIFWIFSPLIITQRESFVQTGILCYSAVFSDYR